VLRRLADSFRNRKTRMPPTHNATIDMPHHDHDAHDGKLHGLTESQLPCIAWVSLLCVALLVLAWIYRYKLSGGRLGYAKGRSPHRRCCFWKKKPSDGGLDHLKGHGIFHMEVVTLPPHAGMQSRYCTRGRWARQNGRGA
jgi:hypothetical protein